MTGMRSVKKWIALAGIPVLCFGLCCACGRKESSEKIEVKKVETDTAKCTKQLYVSAGADAAAADGSQAQPYATIGEAAAQIGPGTEVIVSAGEYPAFELTAAASGTGEAPVVIRAADGENVIVKAPEAADGGDEDRIGIHIVNAQHITLQGLEVTGGTHGICYESTREAGEQPLDCVVIRDCKVHGVRGTHGICVYARNDLAPVTNLIMSGCEVWDCECGDSESTVFNGNVDGFEICGNVIHDNNNIGIDMIGFEGTAKHPKGYKDADGKKANRYENDFVRNGLCHDNFVYGISAEGNDAYLEDGEYDLCADGIYVDGGQDIKIYDNFIFDCDIGLEVATEHSPDDNELFKVSGIEVCDNVIADCTGWCGICFGGYDKDLGFTEGCVFHNNTLIDNETQIGVQRSRDNDVYANLLVGGGSAVEFNEDCRKEDLVNRIRDNAACGFGDEDSWSDDYGRIYKDKSEVIEDYRSRFEGIGSAFVPDADQIAVYEQRKQGE